MKTIPAPPASGTHHRRPCSQATGCLPSRTLTPSRCPTSGPRLLCPTRPFWNPPWRLSPQPSCALLLRGTAPAFSRPRPHPPTLGPQSPAPVYTPSPLGPHSPSDPCAGTARSPHCSGASAAGPTGTWYGTPTLASPLTCSRPFRVCAAGESVQAGQALRLVAGADPAAVPSGRGGRPRAACFTRSPRLSFGTL